MPDEGKPLTFLESAQLDLGDVAHSAIVEMYAMDSAILHELMTLPENRTHNEGASMPDDEELLNEEDDIANPLPFGEIIDRDDDDFAYVMVRYVPENPDPFSIGQSYDETPARQIQCRQCGGVDFHVAMGSYYTAIRCVTCRWEACAHDG